MSAQATARWERVAAASGVGFTVMWVTFAGVGTGVGPIDFVASSDQQIRDLFNAHGSQLRLMASLVQLAAISFVLFSGGLWRALRVAESEPRWISALVLVCGVAAAVGMVTMSALWGVAIHLIEEVPGEFSRFTVHALWDLALTNLVLTSIILSVFYGQPPSWRHGRLRFPDRSASGAGSSGPCSSRGIVLEPLLPVGFGASLAWVAATGVVLYRGADSSPLR